VADTTHELKAIITAENKASAVLSSFKSEMVLTGAAIATALGAATAATYAFEKALRASLDAASQQETADVRLAAALRSIGQNTEQNRKALGAFAGDLRDRLGIADEKIQDVISTLAQFGRLSGENLKRATQATLDYAAATDGDAKSAAIALSKAIEGGAARLPGVVLKIKDTASASERFATIMKTLETNFQGTAEAMGGTFAGSLAKVDNAWNEFLEALGTGILRSEALHVAIDELVGILIDLTGAAKSNEGAITSLTDKFVGLVNHILQAAINAAHLTARLSAFANVARAIPGIGGAVADALSAVGTAGGITEAAADRLQQSVDHVNEALGKTTPIAHDAAAALGKGVKVAATEADDALAKLQEEARLAGLQVRLALEAVTDPEVFKGLSPEAMQEVADALATSFITAADGIRILVESGSHALSEQLRETGTEIESLQTTIDTALRDVGVNSALAFGDALIDAAIMGGVNFKKFFKQMLADMAKAIARALILRAILGIATGGGSEATGGAEFAGFGAGEIGVGARGGIAKGAGGGTLFGGIRNLDSIPALLQPGEIVLPPRTAQAFNDLGEMMAGAKSGTAGAPGAASSFAQMFFQIVPRRDDRDAADLIDQVNTLVERRGYRLAATHVVS
jgi:hypothetical protein